MWWQYLIAAVVVILAVWGFISGQVADSPAADKTDNTAEDVYDPYGDSLDKQRRYAQERGGEWKNGWPAARPGR